jgi:hypothetical protein
MEKSVDQELGLLALFDVRIAKVCSLNGLPVEFVQVSQVRIELGKKGTGIRTGECPANVVRVGPVNDPIKVRFEVDDRVLSFSVGQFGMTCAMDDLEHHRSGQK